MRWNNSTHIKYPDYLRNIRPPSKLDQAPTPPPVPRHVEDNELSRLREENARLKRLIANTEDKRGGSDDGNLARARETTRSHSTGAVGFATARQGAPLASWSTSRPSCTSFQPPARLQQQLQRMTTPILCQTTTQSATSASCEPTGVHTPRGGSGGGSCHSSAAQCSTVASLAAVTVRTAAGASIGSDACLPSTPRLGTSYATPAQIPAAPQKWEPRTGSEPVTQQNAPQQVVTAPQISPQQVATQQKAVQHLAAQQWGVVVTPVLVQSHTPRGRSAPHGPR